jgi:acyl-CoA reductase-like NAD-dependent aldehyde dehydrogenase
MVKFYTTNPTTEKYIAEYQTTSITELKNIFSKAHFAQKDWAKLEVKKRISYFKKLVSAIEKEKIILAHLITKEMGKPIAEAIAEIERCTMPLKYYIENGENLLKNEIVKTQAEKSYIRFEPIGLVAIFSPWNYPLWGIFRQLAPALLCGNGILISPNLKVVGSAEYILKIIKRAGLPNGLVSIVLGDEINEPLIAGVETIIAITSPYRGSIIAGIAGRYLKRVNLELSGSDPFIVLEDADIQSATQHAVMSRLMNTGQDCVAAKRFIIREEIYDIFVEQFVEKMKKIKIGNPVDATTHIGPLGDKNLLKILKIQIDDAIQKGAKLILGGKKLKQKGYFFQPTVLVNVKPNMKVWQEETYGPVAAIMAVKDDQRAIAMANNSPFGLGASIWTKNVKRGNMFVEKLESGMVFINDQPKSNPAMPFGGIKQSGMGRDFSKYGLLHFLNTKSVFIFK